MAVDTRNRRLHRSTHDRMLGGVCGGLAEYFDVAPDLVRVGFVAVTLAGGAGVLAYLILWLLVPADESDQTSPVAGRRRGRELAGLVLIGLGLALFADAVGWIHGVGGVMIWPVVLILVGLALVTRRTPSP
jgi:phage shock protein C